MASDLLQKSLGQRFGNLGRSWWSTSGSIGLWDFCCVAYSGDELRMLGAKHDNKVQGFGGSNLGPQSVEAEAKSMR